MRLASLALCAVLAGPCLAAPAPPWAERARIALEGSDLAAARALADEAASAPPRDEASRPRAAALLRFLLDSGDGPAARRLAEALLPVSRAGREPDEAFEATLHNAMGEAAFEAGEAREALALFERSLRVRERVLGPSHALVAESLNNRGVVRQGLGLVKEARADFERSLAIRERVLPADHRDVAESVNALGVLAHATGDYGRAEKWLVRAKGLRERNPGPDTLAAAESAANLAELYREIGDIERALPLQERALAIREARVGPRHLLVGESLNNLALLHVVRGRHAEAESHYRRAIEIHRAQGGRHATVATLENNLGMLMLRQRRLDEAARLLASSLQARRSLLGPDHPRTARSLDNLSKVAIARGDYEGAGALLSEALAIAEAAGDPDSRWRILDTLRRLEAARGNRPQAIVYGKRAVNLLQALRLNLRTLEKSLQQSFARDKGEAYRALVDLLMSEGRLAEAEQVLAMMKEDEHYDFILRAGASDPRVTTVALTPSETEISGRTDRAGLEVVKRIRERSALLAKGQRSAEDDRRLEVLNEERRLAIRAFNDALGEIHRYATSEAVNRARARELGAMNLANLKSIQGTLAALGEGVVAVHYVVLEQRTRILVTTPLAQVARDSAVEAAELGRLIGRFRRALQHREPHEELSRRLYGILVQPIAADLEQAGARTLMLSLDGVLRYVPFAALADGEGYLVERFRLALFSDAARDKLKDPPASEWRAAALGLTEAAEGFESLPSVAEEVRAIVRTGSSGPGVLAGRIALDSAFSRAALLSALEEGFPIVHLASHFVFTPGAELESYLLLGDKTRLSLKEIKDEDFDFRSVELVTLSACETAVGGGSDQFGREIEGFAALVQRQGARSVMATLWKVSDESTALLMRMFYASRTLGGLSKAEALRQAQLALLRGDLEGDLASAARGAGGEALRLSPAARAKHYRHPFFWAPFILAGNWR